MSEGTPPPPPPENPGGAQPPGGSVPPPPPTSEPAPPTTPGPGGYAAAPPPPPPTAPGSAGYGGPTAPTAGNPLLDRFLARFIDGIIVAIVGFIINRVIVAAIFDPGTTTTLSGLAGATIAYIVISSIISTALYLGYFGYLESSQGKTIGKMVMKLRVESVTGGNPTLQQAIKRNIWLGAAILGVIPLLGSIVGGIIEIVAAIMIAVQINSDPENRPWTDRYAETRVVKEG